MFLRKLPKGFHSMSGKPLMGYIRIFFIFYQYYLSSNRYVEIEATTRGYYHSKKNSHPNFLDYEFTETETSKYFVDRLCIKIEVR